MACRICRRPYHNARSCKKKARSKLKRNPIPKKSRELRVGDRVWVSGHQIESGTVVSIRPGYEGEKHRRIKVSVPGKYEHTIDTSENQVWPTEKEAIAAEARQRKLHKRWTDDIEAQEGMELLAIEHDYRADYFKAVDLMEEGYEHFQAIKKFGQHYKEATGISIKPDEGFHVDKAGVFVSAIIPKRQSLGVAEAEANKLLRELNKNIGRGWKLIFIAIDSKIKRSIHTDELEELYGKDLRHRRHNPSALWGKTKRVAGKALRATGKLMPGYMDPRAIRMFGSWALDYAIPREVRAEFLRELDANLNLGRSECLANFGEEHCQKVEAAAISLGKKWAATNRKIEEAIGRDGQFDAWLDVFNSELEAAKAKKQPAALRGNPEEGCTGCERLRSEVERLQDYIEQLKEEISELKGW